MKNHSHNVRSHARAFTLAEMMIALSVVMMVLAGLLTSHLCGMRMFQITRAKISASHDARKALSQITDEIRGAKWVEVGVFSNKVFKPVARDAAQQGNAIQIYNSATNSPFVRYYLDPVAQQLYRVTNNTMAPLLIAHSVTNYLIFSCQDMLGNVLTTNQNNRVVALDLSFYQIEYPILKVGPGQHYDFYQLSTKITRRTLE